MVRSSGKTKKSLYLKRILFSLFAGSFLLSGCAKPGALATSDASNNSSNQQQSSDVTGTQKLVLSKAMTLRYPAGGVLENAVTLPIGTQIEFPMNYQIITDLKARQSDGSLVWSSTGFLSPLQIVALPKGSSVLTPIQIDQLNNQSLFLDASIAASIQGVTGYFAPITPVAPGSGFLADYQESGKPKFVYTKSAAKRFGTHMNKGVDPSTQSAAAREKWQKIYNEIKSAGDRTVATAKSYLMMDQTVATQWSKDYESSRLISPLGAWSVAVNGTAVRHGFANTPCAEFMSEILREAYQRAGYAITDDFSVAKGNEIIWSITAAVVNFSAALDKAGWIPWDTTMYRPPVGAFLMNGAGETPGHTYLAAGEDGRFIVDNGSPQGRDLRGTSKSIIEMMYQTGLFFLPPGINPDRW